MRPTPKVAKRCRLSEVTVVKTLGRELGLSRVTHRTSALRCFERRYELQDLSDVVAWLVTPLGLRLADRPQWSLACL